MWNLTTFSDKIGIIPFKIWGVEKHGPQVAKSQGGFCHLEFQGYGVDTGVLLFAMIHEESLLIRLVPIPEKKTYPANNGREQIYGS